MSKLNRKIRKLIIFLLLVFIATIFLYKPAMKLYYPLKYDDTIETYSSKYNIDKYLVMGVISAESRFDKDAQSHKGAKGLMQLTESTANWCISHFGININEKDLHSVQLNIEIGCVYLEYLIDTYSNIETALAAYNAGPGNVNKWLKNKEYSEDGTTLHSIPFKETKQYVENVIKRREIYYKLYKQD